MPPGWLVPIQVPGGVILCLVGAFLMVRGTRMIVAGARDAGAPDQSLRVIRGFRAGILGIGTVCLGVALWRWSAPWAIFAAIFLFEELIETSIQAAAARAGSRNSR
jgi:hypothetical protein